MRVLAISGSLQARSSNRAMIEAAAAVAPYDVEFVVADMVGELPHFNPDLDEEGAEMPAPVARWRAMVGDADGIVISSPEYAHGVPGSLKNALDWLVSTPALFEKPVLLLNAAPAGGSFVQNALAETLRTMNADVLGASLIEPFVTGRITGSGLGPEAAALLRGSMDGLAQAIRARQE